MTLSGESICKGRDRGDGHCLDCTLPMRNHPITFVMPQDHPDPYIRKLAEGRPMMDSERSDSKIRISLTLSGGENFSAIRAFDAFDATPPDPAAMWRTWDQILECARIEVGKLDVG